MGLDIYAGTLTRYYTRSWKTVTQQQAELQGWGYEVIRKSDAPGADYPISAIQADLQQWSNTVADLLSSSIGASLAAWEEDNEKDYYTNKPDWSGWGAFLLYGACLLYDRPLPPTIQKDWQWQSDPIVALALADGSRNWSLFSQGAEWWLPFDDAFTFRYPAPNGHEITMGTTAALLYELRSINALGWQADDATILGWVQTEGFPVDAESAADGSIRMLDVHTEYDTQSLAKFACSILYHAVLFSNRHRVPVIMDY